MQIAFRLPDPNTSGMESAEGYKEESSQEKSVFSYMPPHHIRSNKEDEKNFGAGQKG